MFRLRKFVLFTALAPLTVIAASRAVYLSGTVSIDDGSILNGIADIQAMCGSALITVGHTDLLGAFRFQWDHPTSVGFDADQSGEFFAPSAPPVSCELSAKYAGFGSSHLNIDGPMGQQSLDVGNIILHRMEASGRTTINALSFKAPPQAKKNFGKGERLLTANKMAEAVAEFSRALEIYPQYVDAWIALGKTQWRLGDNDAARNSFARAIGLDSKASVPWQHLGFIACEESKWEDAARYLDRAVRLDPASPASWYFDAIANYKLGHLEKAEAGVHSQIRLTHTSDGRSSYLLALILIARKDFEGATPALRNTIAASRADSKEAQAAQNILSRIEAAALTVQTASVK